MRAQRKIGRETGHGERKGEDCKTRALLAGRLATTTLSDQDVIPCVQMCIPLDRVIGTARLPEQVARRSDAPIVVFRGQGLREDGVI